MVAKENFTLEIQLRDSYESLQREFCELNQIDHNTLVDSGEWFEKFNLWRNERVYSKQGAIVG